MVKDNHAFFELANDIKQLSEPLKKYLRVHYFAFKRTYDDGSKIYLFNRPDYYRHWFDQKYYLIGNREANPTSYENGYHLWEHLPDPYRLYDEGADLFNIAHGLTVTRRHDGYCDFFFYGTTRENEDIKQAYVDRRDIFEKFGDYFLDKSRSLILRAEQSKIILPFSPELKASRPAIQIEGFLREISCEGNQLEILTQREVECACYVAQGKSYKEIARLLSLSPRTVEEHASNVRKKFGCRNKSQLISHLSKLIP